MNLQFGLNNAIPTTIKTAWGARFIFPNDLLVDRQDMQGPDMEPLKEWLNGGALRSARETARTASESYYMTFSGNQTVILYQDGQGVVVACPNGSCGYVYVAAWLHNGDPAKMPTAEFQAIPKPKPVRAARKKAVGRR